MRTRVWPPRAVGFDTSTSRQTYGAPSCSKNVLRLISIASRRLAMIRRTIVSGTIPERHADPLAAADQCRGAVGGHAPGLGYFLRRRLAAAARGRARVRRAQRGRSADPDSADAAAVHPDARPLHVCPERPDAV